MFPLCPSLWTAPGSASSCGVTCKISLLLPLPAFRTTELRCPLALPEARAEAANMGARHLSLMLCSWLQAWALPSVQSWGEGSNYKWSLQILSVCQGVTGTVMLSQAEKDLGNFPARERGVSGLLRALGLLKLPSRVWDALCAPGSCSWNDLPSRALKTANGWQSRNPR